MVMPYQTTGGAQGRAREVRGRREGEGGMKEREERRERGRKRGREGGRGKGGREGVRRGRQVSPGATGSWRLWQLEQLMLFMTDVPSLASELAAGS